MSASEYYEEELERVTMSELKRRKGSVLYDAEKDQLDFEGKKFTGEFLRLVNEFKTEEQKQKELYACMLKVPESGTPWLDEMIQKARRDEFAKHIAQGYTTIDLERVMQDEYIAKWAYQTADALLAESKKKKESE